MEFPLPQVHFKGMGLCFRTTTKPKTLGGPTILWHVPISCVPAEHSAKLCYDVRHVTAIYAILWHCEAEAARMATQHCKKKMWPCPKRPMFALPALPVLLDLRPMTSVDQEPAPVSLDPEPHPWAGQEKRLPAALHLPESNPQIYPQRDARPATRDA